MQILQSASASNTYAFGMRVDEGPFADNRIRQAFKLFTDRQALIDGALAGFGTVGNDLQGPNTQYFASDLKSEYDPDKAKSLFQAAGRRGHTPTSCPWRTCCPEWLSRPRSGRSRQRPRASRSR